jgi:hypothetical protein
MRRLLPILAPLLLALGAPGVAEEPETAPDDRAARTGAAVRRGVQYLLAEQRPDGSWSGVEGKTALALLALHRSGIREGHKRFDRGLRWLLAHRNKLATYGTALTILVLCEVSPTEHRETIRKLALRLVLGQCTNGQWTYKCVRSKKRGDNSNTQFALLALWYARLAGTPVPPHVWSRAGRHWRSTQNPDGGWGYSANQRRDSYGSMTAAGLSSLAIVMAAEQDGPGVDLQAILADRRVRQARDWLGRELRVDEHPGVERNLRGQLRDRKGKKIKGSHWRIYWLWSLERAGRLTDRERFGEHDWYREGADALLDEQRDDGRWVSGAEPEVATSFALLFLTRGTKPVTTKPVTGTATEAR